MAQDMMNYSKNISHGSRHDELHELYFSIQGLVVVVFNATFNIISVVSWSVLLVDEAGVHGENHRTAQVNAKLYHIIGCISLFNIHLTLAVM